MNPSVEIARYIVSAGKASLPDEVAAKTKLHLIDSVAAVISGSRLKPGKFAASFAAVLGKGDEALVLGTNLITTAVNAALANGMAGHADETDDSHLRSRSHLGCAVIPAAFAMGERKGASGRALLNAVALGYDIGSRSVIALGFGPATTQKHSTHSIATTFGSMAAALSLIDPTEEQAIYALSYAAQQASGIPCWNRDPDHIEKAFDFGGMGARNGVFAALIVEAGATGVTDPLIGHHSFLEAFGVKPNPDALTSGLGQKFEIMEASIKKWSVGSPIQSALDSLSHLIQEHRIKPGDVAEMIAHMPDDRLHVVDNREAPDICLQHLLAVMLVDGDLTFATSHDPSRMADPEVIKARAKIKAVPSAELTAARPERQSIIELRLNDGRVVSQRTYAVHGTPQNPMNADDVLKKAGGLIAPVIGEDNSKTLLDRLMKIEAVGDVRELRDLMRGVS